MCKLSGETVEDILRHGRIYEVGGAVRDQLLDRRIIVKDRDYLVTGIPYDRLTTILENHGRVDLVGASFGVIKFTQFRNRKSFTFDITLPRREHSTGVGHKQFEVGFDPDLAVGEDLRRRDFTINAMALALDDNQLVDSVGGRKDLEDRLLRTVYPESFEDDPLRMLRAVQFAARFDFEIESETLAQLKRHAHLVATVSPERIAEELNKLLVLAARPSVGFRLMQESGLLKVIFPELEACVGVDQPGGYHKYDVFEHTLQILDACPARLELRMAGLFHDIRKPQHKRLVDNGATFYGHESGGAKTALEVLGRLRYSKDFARKVSTLVERHMFTTDVTDKGLRRLVRKVGKELIFDLLDLRRADVVAQGMGGTTEDVDRFEADIRAEFERKSPFGLEDLAIGGNDIMRLLELHPGPEVGWILNQLLEAVLDYPEKNTVEQLELIAQKAYRSHIGRSDKDEDEG